LKNNTFSWAILGAGAWGTALAVHLTKTQSPQGYLVARRQELAQNLIQTRENTLYLPGIQLNPSIQITTYDALAWQHVNLFFIACPTKGLVELATILKSNVSKLSPQAAFVVLCKGLEPSTRLTPLSWLSQQLPNNSCGVLSGPNNALEVAESKPTAAVLSFKNPYALAQILQSHLSNKTLRVYYSDDAQGVELGGCLKNVYAIGAGVIDALQLGDNSKAAYLTRVLQELIRLGVALGGRKETFLGLSGIGDLTATCYGAWSRNRSFGEAIGKGESAATFLAKQKTVVEGYTATKSFFELSKQFNTDFPVLTEIYQLLYHDKLPQDAIHALMNRELKAE
jgi:glycerol-3-phosphate dehydrogenase (NAD(P)+)